MQALSLSQTVLPRVLQSMAVALAQKLLALSQKQPLMLPHVGEVTLTPQSRLADAIQLLLLLLQVQPGIVGHIDSVLDPQSIKLELMQ